MRRSTVLTMLLLTLLPTGCRWGASSRPATYAEARAAYAAGDYRRAAQLFATYNGGLGKAEHADAARYYEGMCLLQMNQPGGAGECFEQVLRESGESELQALALAGNAERLRLERRYAEAENVYARLVTDYAETYPPDEALAAWVQTRQARGDTAGAASLRRRLAREYPQSPYLQQADASVRAKPARFAVQLIRTYPSVAAAEPVRARLKAARFDSFIARRVTGMGTVYIIQAGAFHERASAVKRQQALARAGFQASIQ